MPQAAAKAKKKAAPRRPTKAKAKAPTGTSAFGRPGTAGKAEGDAALRAWIQGVSPAHRPIVERLDALIQDVVPGVKRAIKWSMPMYGLPGTGWFANVASFKSYVRLGFFSGTSLDPPPPVGGGKGMRQANIGDMSQFDERQFRSWIKQASSIKGWGTV